MTLKEWYTKNGVPYDTTANGTVSVYGPRLHHEDTTFDIRHEMFHLSDYTVSSYVALVYWLVPRVLANQA